MPGPGGKVSGYITAHLLATVWQQLCQFAEVHVLMKRNRAEMTRVNREAAGCKMGGFSPTRSTWQPSRWASPPVAACWRRWVMIKKVFCVFFCPEHMMSRSTWPLTFRHLKFLRFTSIIIFFNPWRRLCEILMHSAPEFLSADLERDVTATSDHLIDPLQGSSSGTQGDFQRWFSWVFFYLFRT